MFIITKGFSYLSSDSVSFEDESKNKRNIYLEIVREVVGGLRL